MDSNTNYALLPYPLQEIFAYIRTFLLQKYTFYPNKQKIFAYIRTFLSQTAILLISTRKVTHKLLTNLAI